MAAISACSLAETFLARAWALAIAAKAGSTASGSMGALMLGPNTMASPQ